MHKNVRKFKWFLLVLAGLTFVFSITYLPYLAGWFAWKFPMFAYLEYPTLFFIWGTSVGFYYIVVLILNICSNIQSGKSFTVTTATLFDRIALIALVELIAYIIGFVVITLFIQYVHPIIALVMFVVAFICLVLLAFCLVMKRLVRRVVEIKEENEYTI